MRGAEAEARGAAVPYEATALHRVAYPVLEQRDKLAAGMVVDDGCELASSSATHRRMIMQRTGEREAWSKPSS